MIAIIVAFPPNKVIGNSYGLPWHIPEDLQHFKDQTRGKTVIMGRKTFDTIGKPLPKRNNIILGRKGIDVPGADVCTSIDEALDKAKSYGEDIFVAGGASIYRQFLPIVDKLYISHIKENYEGDVYFPDYDKNKWVPEYREDKGPFEFVIYKRN